MAAVAAALVARHAGSGGSSCCGCAGRGQRHSSQPSDANPLQPWGGLDACITCSYCAAGTRQGMQSGGLCRVMRCVGCVCVAACCVCGGCGPWSACRPCARAQGGRRGAVRWAGRRGRAQAGGGAGCGAAPRERERTCMRLGQHSVCTVVFECADLKLADRLQPPFFFSLRGFDCP